MDLQRAAFAGLEDGHKLPPTCTRVTINQIKNTAPEIKLLSIFFFRDPWDSDRSLRRPAALSLLRHWARLPFEVEPNGEVIFEQTSAPDSFEDPSLLPLLEAVVLLAPRLRGSALHWQPVRSR